MHFSMEFYRCQAGEASNFRFYRQVLWERANFQSNNRMSFLLVFSFYGAAHSQRLHSP